VEKSLWENGVRKDASAKGLGSCDRVKRRVCAKKGESVLIVKGRKRRGTGICRRSAKKGVYLTFKVTSNLTSSLCGKKGWKTKDGTGLSAHKPVDDKKWVLSSPHSGYIGWSGKEKDVYKARPKMR